MMDGETSIPEIELIIKASTIDGRRKGACLFCQEYFMDLYLLAELKTISLKITTVDMLKPPPDFRFESLLIRAFLVALAGIWVTPVASSKAEETPLNPFIQHRRP